ncbi:hypothetical protein BamIOP4010DRAFT_3295 [Burkholderia ambifaria IOP40-10]|uniref:Uncharacterized protein n=1 Tax=Burkholderia ambifaria IOP40-10 TaxID=396596 RepID=B1FGY5_9BURK|nr:hypothetical protein BamIOP4010DRAFT_3295 [Burkholderia ambifaria IOP40-10]
MPSISPLITLPTARPRCASGAIDAAIGTSIWITLDAAPAASVASKNTVPDRVKAGSASAAAQATSVTTIRRRFSSRSTSGTSSTRPAA